MDIVQGCFYGLLVSTTNMAVNGVAGLARFVSGIPNMYSAEDVKREGGEVISLEGNGLTRLSDATWYEKQFVADWKNFEFKVFIQQNSIEETSRTLLE